MAFNGSGTFNRLYSWVQDAANGINIDSTRMDNETNGIATGLSNCVTRDGQSPFLANIPAGGFKITGLGTPNSTGDAATFEYVNTVASTEWKLETNSVAWVAATQFKVVGVNLTTTYHVGRRVKIVHNTGGTTSYGTITASAFVTDTTVTVAVDGAAALVSTVTAVSYGLLSYTNPSYLDPRSYVFAYLNGDTAYVASTTVKINCALEVFDTNSEFTGGTFTAQHPGYYLATLNVLYKQTSQAARYLRPIIYKNGGLEAQTTINDGLVAVALSETDVMVTALVLLAKGDTLEPYFVSLNAGTLESGNTYNVGTRFQIVRLA